MIFLAAFARAVFARAVIYSGLQLSEAVFAPSLTVWFLPLTAIDGSNPTVSEGMPNRQQL